VLSMDPHEDTARKTLEMLEAILAAIDRRDEVMDTVSSSDDADQAAEGLRQLLGVSSFAAVDLLNMRWRMFTRAERQKVQDRINELRDRT
jgi:DNA gyrase/topoisomerase IV subunit A